MTQGLMNPNGHDVEKSQELTLSPSATLAPKRAGGLEAITRGEVDMQVTTAKRYPRDLERFLAQSKFLVTSDPKTAASCFYSLPARGKDGKKIEGPSTHLASILANQWGNLRCETRVVDETDKHIVAQATVWDMENNVAIKSEVLRRITDKTGRKYGDDMVAVTGNAACSIALRNALFRVIPAAFVNTLFEQAKRAAAGDMKDLPRRRADAVAYWDKQGVPVDKVLGLVGRTRIDDIDIDDLATLSGVRTAIKEGTTTLADAFDRGVVDAPGPLPAGKDFGFGDRQPGSDG